MGNYTTQIRFICESKSGLTESVGFSGIMTAINNSVNDIFNFEWPIFDETYRVPLEVKILRHFYTREIGEETFGLWQLRLCDRLNVIMPYYNQLYKSELIKFNPLYDVDLTTEHEKANDGEINKTETGTHEFTNNTNRTGNKNSVEDGINDTDFVGNKTSSVDGSQTEKNNITSEKSGIENRTDNAKVEDSNTTSANVENNSISTDKNVNRYSDTPQGNVNIGGGPNDGNPSVDSVFGNGYLTNVTIVDGENKNKGTNQSDSISNSESITSANQNVSRDDVESSEGNRLLNNAESRSDNERNSTRSNSSKIVNDDTKENIAGSGEHTNNVTGRINNMSVEDYIQKVSGKRGGLTYSKMLNEFRDTFLNIDKMVLNDLDSLFIALWE